MTASQGWWRFPGHFLIWAAVPNILSYILFALGVDTAWLGLLGWPSLFFFSMIVFLREVGQVSFGTHTLAKGALDFSSKVGGFAVGVLTWQWWWF